MATTFLLTIVFCPRQGWTRRDAPPAVLLGQNLRDRSLYSRLPSASRIRHPVLAAVRRHAADALSRAPLLLLGHRVISRSDGDDRGTQRSVEQIEDRLFVIG